jgi:dephospho-CoA kinase
MIIGITGTNGSGKGTVVEYLVSEKGFAHYGVRDFLTAQLVTSGRTVDRSEMRLLANELRATKDPAYIIRSLYEKAVADGVKHAVIESVRNVGEAEFLKSKGVFLVATDADQQLRFNRVQERRSATDQVDFLTFVHHEEREMKPEGPHDMDIRGVMALADATIENNTTKEMLHAAVEDVIAPLYA